MRKWNDIWAREYVKQHRIAMKKVQFLTTRDAKSENYVTKLSVCKPGGGAAFGLSM